MDGAVPFIFLAIALAIAVAAAVAFRKGYGLGLLSGALIGTASFLIWPPISVWPSVVLGLLPFTMISAAVGAGLGLLINRKTRS